MKPQTLIQGTVHSPQCTETGSGRRLCKFLLVEETPRGQDCYPVVAWGGLADLVAAMVGRAVMVTARVDSREYQGRHYVDLVADGVFASAEPEPARLPAPSPAPAYTPPRQAAPAASSHRPGPAQPAARPMPEQGLDALDDVPF